MDWGSAEVSIGTFWSEKTGGELNRNLFPDYNPDTASSIRLAAP